MQKISQNGGMLQQMMMLAQMVDAKGGGGEITSGLARQFGIPVPGASDTNVSDKEALGGESGSGEAANTKKARQRVADSTSPT